MAAKKNVDKSASAKTLGSKALSKAAFVREHASLSPRDIVAKAKAAGIKIGIPYVYNVRAYDRTSKAKGRMTTGRRARRAGGAPLIHSMASGSSAASAEGLLKAVAAEVGLARAIEILQGERARVHAVLRG